VQIKLNQLFFNQKYKYMLTKASYKELNGYLSKKSQFVGVDGKKLDNLKKRNHQLYIGYLRAQNTFNSFTKVYKLTHSKHDLKSAYKLAKTKKQKAIMEQLFVEKLGFKRLFDIKIIKKESKIKTSKTAGFATSMVYSYKDINFHIVITPKPNAPIKLKYNTYKVKLKFILHLVLKTDFMQKRFRDVHHVKDFVLSPHNSYRSETSFDEKVDIAGTVKGVMIINGRSRYTVKDYEVKRIETSYKIMEFKKK
jgi:hypothetical protein